MHPVHSLFIGTVPVGLATIVNATVLVAVHQYGQWALTLAWTLWWIDVVSGAESSGCKSVDIKKLHFSHCSLQLFRCSTLQFLLGTCFDTVSYRCCRCSVVMDYRS